ncbi:hypothetical protein F5878DRAFT_646916, partial [Lentinula raphanica]
LVPPPSPSLVPPPSPSLVPPPSPSLVPPPSPSLVPPPSPSLVPPPSPSLVPPPSPSLVPLIMLENGDQPPLDQEMKDIEGEQTNSSKNNEEPLSLPSLSLVPPSLSPSLVPPSSPSLVPTPSPSLVPTSSPSLVPTPSPSLVPTSSPSLVPPPSPSLVPPPSPSLMPPPSPSLVPPPSPSLVPLQSQEVDKEMIMLENGDQPPLDQQMKDIEGEQTNSSKNDEEPLSPPSPSLVPPPSPSLVPPPSPSLVPPLSPSLLPLQNQEVDKEMIILKNADQPPLDQEMDQQSSDEEPLVRALLHGSNASLPQPLGGTKRKPSRSPSPLSNISPSPPPDDNPAPPPDTSSQEDSVPDPKPKSKRKGRKKKKKFKTDIESEDEDYPIQPTNSENTVTNLCRSSRITAHAIAATAAALTRIEPKCIRPWKGKAQSMLSSENEDCEMDEDSEEDNTIPLFEPIPHNPLQSRGTYQLLHHDGTRSVPYQQYSHNSLPAFQLQYVMSTIHSQTKADRRILDNGQSNPEWKPPTDYPIREVSVNEWDIMSIRQRLALYQQARGGLFIRGRDVERDRYHVEEEEHIERLLGDLEKLRTLHDASRTLNRPADCHTLGTLKDVKEAALVGNKIVNCLEIPLPSSWVRPPEVICTKEQADTAGLERVYKTGLSWGLFATSHAVHQFHVDCEGHGTWVMPYTGSKYWVVAVPKKESDFASTEMFGEAFEVDGHNCQQWGLYGFILEPGDMLTAYSWFHNFVAASTITNTVDHNAFEGLISIVAFWHHSIVEDSERYLKNMEKLEDSTLKPRSNASRDLMIHLPNFNCMEDTIQFLTLVNLIKLIPVLDIRRYREQSGRYSQSTNFVVPPDFKARTQHANVLVSQLLAWVSETFQFHQYAGPRDDFAMHTRLKNLSQLYLCKQAQTLVYEKVLAEQMGMHGEDKTVTARAVKQAIEEDIICGSLSMQKLWPMDSKELDGETVEDWAMQWSNKEPQSYDWETAVQGRKYMTYRVQPVASL